ncbi:MAG: glutamate--tRNA ligase [Candidatus Aminicenantaceae bacterium]
MVKVRFAPSPTGHLHIGAARTAIYNWLYARHEGGQFILRIEDTDVERSSEEMTQGILDGMKWLGMDWDKGPIYQSQRLDLYRIKAQELVDAGKAYYCFCTAQEIEERRAATEAAGEYWWYDRRCRELSDGEREAFEAEDRLKAIRFAVPDQGLVRYKDMIRGKIEVQNETIEDFVLLRSDGQPTYHLSVVVDDMELGITHVIRGSDHISNTPKQILLYLAFGAPVPRFGHQSLILGQDKKKLSKRHGVTSVLQFREDGFLSLAMLNYLAQMSWSPGEERIYSIDEMIAKFYLDKRSRGNPVFDLTKLEWLNGQLISAMPAEELFPRVKEELDKAGLWDVSLAGERREWLLRLIDLLKERSRRMTDFALRAKPFLADAGDIEYEQEAVDKHLQDERLGELILKLADDLAALDIGEYTAERIEEVLRARAEAEDVKAGALIHAARVLVLGTKVSPGIFQVLELMGRDRTIVRLRQIDKVK